MHHREVAAQEVVERGVKVLGAEKLLDGLPVRAVEVALLGHGIAHEHEVAHEVGYREVLARGVHGLEDHLRVVLSLRERDRDDLQPLQAMPYEVDVVERGDASLEEREVVQKPPALVLRRLVIMFDCIYERLVTWQVVLGERELVVVVARAEPVGEVAAFDDLVAAEGVCPRSLSGQRHEQQGYGRDALLPVDEQQGSDPLFGDRAVLNGDDGAREVRGMPLASRGEDVVPELGALRLVPRIRALVDRYHESRVHLADEA